MPEHFAGKTFYAPGELPLPPQEEIDAADAAFAAFEAARAAVPEDQKIHLRPDHYGNDLDGTEFEGWTHNPQTGQWFDAHGRPAYDTNGQRVRYPDDSASSDVE